MKCALNGRINNLDLSEVKRSEDLLCAVLGVPVGSRLVKCCFHEDKNNPNLKIYATDGIWFFKCFACGKTGTVIDAIMFRDGHTNFQQALTGLEKKLGIKIAKDVETVEIVLDMERAERVLTLARETLANDFEVQEAYMLERRRISDLKTLQKYGVGFLKDKIIKPELVRWGIMRFWVFPITDENGKLKWVKCHRENTPYDCPKAFAFPLGTYPPLKWGPDRKPIQKPKHGTVSLFPAPELIPRAEILYLSPGELKALNLLALGFSSTSLTQGEAGEIPGPLLARIKKLFTKVCLVYDNDTAGIAWREAITKQLRENGFLVASFTYAELRGGSNALVKADGMYVAVEGQGLTTGETVKFPKNWKSEPLPILDPAQEYDALKRELLAAGVELYEGDTIETLRQAKSVLEAIARPNPGGRRIDNHWVTILELNRQSAVREFRRKQRAQGSKGLIQEVRENVGTRED